MDDVRSVAAAQTPKNRRASARTPEQVGMVAAVSGFKLSCALFGADVSALAAAYERVQIGALIRIPTATTVAFGFIDSLNLRNPDPENPAQSLAIAEVELLGELTSRRDGSTKFSRGLSVYPVLGAPVFPASADDLALIYIKPNVPALPIGTLHQDPGKIAYLISQEFLCKHSAILGTTGSGKSCALTIILRSLLNAHPNGHVLLLDPHGEYAPAFQGLAERITTHTLELPYWLLSFEEITEVFCSREPIARSHESNILKDAIIVGKREFLGTQGIDQLITVDTPTPYRLSAVLQRISEGMGRLDKPDSTLPYRRLLSTIENLRQDQRYAFLFGGLTLRDNMPEILSRLLRIPVKGKPITILDISAVPSEIVNVVVSLICRLIFDVALWSDRDTSVPMLLVCDEAHRYIPRDESMGFEPTRRAISRIAKEGRKYGVSLCLVTQRPSEISETILSQCSTMFALRMSNEKDQNLVRRTLPETAAGLLNTLPTLRQQEAIAIGEGVPHPMRIRFADLDQRYRPRGEATNFPRAWEDDQKGEDYLKTIIDRWRWQSG
ncbi:MAG TPA: ATP-binding protein [Stellaceae bacterium]|nr:ATP-binding protein [Stellaceae bacterium]